MYLSLLLVLLTTEFFAAGLIFNLGSSLQLAKTHQSGLLFLHDQLGALYDGSKCRGGQPRSASEAIPFNFSQVECQDKAVSQALNSILRNANISEEKEYATYKKCAADPAFNSTSEEFTRAFCGSEAQIVSLAGRYGQYLVVAPICLGVLTFILMVTFILLVPWRQQKTQRPQTVVSLMGARGYYNNTRTVQVQTEPDESETSGLQIFARHRSLSEP